MSEMIAEQLNCDAETITADTSFKDDLGADSLDLFELVMALEDEYNIEIPAEELTSRPSSRTCRASIPSPPTHWRRLSPETIW